MVIIVPKVCKSERPYSPEEERHMILLIEAEMGKPPPPLSRKGKTLLALFWIAGLVTVAVSMYATLSGGPRSQGSAPAATEAR